ncbi:MAG: phospholipid carrier-dependent glycosyltransferase [Sumerlaeia bacterium]
MAQSQQGEWFERMETAMRRWALAKEWLGAHRADAIAVAVLLLYGFVAPMLTTGRFGMTWDEGYYYPAYEDARQWIVLLVQDPGAALSPSGIEAGWAEISELPPVTKWLHAPLTVFGSGMGKLYVLRLVPAALFAATLALIFLTVRRTGSTAWALLGAACYGLHPRLFGHAHFAASETVFCFLTAAVLCVAGGDLARRRTKAGLVVLLGLALATKVNGLILIVAVGGWLALRVFFGILEHRRVPRPESASAIKHALIAAALLLLAPVVALAIWPWMWHDTAARIAGYWQFIREHSHQGVWYLGEKYNFPDDAPKAPWHYVPVMLAATMPVVFLVLGAWGIWRAGWRFLRERMDFDALLLLAFIGPLSATMLPSSPKYDGIRLFLPALVPLAMMAGRLGEAQLWRRERLRWAPWCLAGAIALTAGPFLPRGLSYYNLPLRIVAPEGHDFPFETTYWGEGITPGRLLDVVPPDARIKTRALHTVVFDLYRDWGVLPETMSFDGPPPYDFHLIQNRKGFWGNVDWWLAGNREPLAVWPPDSGNPQWILFDGRPPGGS